MVVAVLVAAILGAVPNLLPSAVRDALPGWLPSRQITLGLDLQGGSHLLLEVEAAAVLKDRLEVVMGDVRVA